MLTCVLADVESQGGPKPEWLQALWQALMNWSTSEQQGNPAWDPLAGWALLPVCGGDLVRLAHRHIVVTPPLAAAPDEEEEEEEDQDSSQPAPAFDESWQALVPALLEAGCFVLDPRFASCTAVCNAAYVDAVAGGGEDALLIRKLRATSALGKLRPGALSPTSRRALLTWLASQAAAGQLPPAGGPDHSFLRSLPLYPNLNGDLVPVAREESMNSLEAASGVCSAAVIASVLGSAHALPLTVKRLLLQHEDELAALYSSLGVEEVDAATLIAGTLGSANGFAALDSGAAASLLQYVETNWAALEVNSTLMTTLKGCQFVTTSGGSLAAPQALFDPSVPLLSSIFAGQPVFPAGRFAATPWLGILQQLGLKRSLDGDAFVEAAKSVAAQQQAAVLVAPGETVSAEAGRTWEAATALAGHLATDGLQLLQGPGGDLLGGMLREVSERGGGKGSGNNAAPLRNS